MKHIKITGFLAAAIAVTFSACEKTIDEKTAIANFKIEVEGVAKSVNTKSAPGANILVVMSESITKYQSIKTDGLPAGLAAAWTEMNAAMSEMSVAMSEINAIVDIVDKNVTGDKSQLGAELLIKLNNSKGKVSVAGKKLQEEGTKYGLDMQKIMNGK